MAPQHVTALAIHHLLAVLLLLVEGKNRKKRTYQSAINARRPQQSHWHNLIQEIWLGNADDATYLRMTKGSFEQLVMKMSPLLTKQPTHRFPITVGERLGMTLRFLASGDAQTSMATNFRVGKSTLHMVLKETTEALWECLKDEVLKFPSTPDEWKDIAAGFGSRWNFQNCVGAIDGKHVVMQAPPMSGSGYYNYKNQHSLILMAACDSNYCFTFVDIGAPGRQSDGRVFAASALGRGLVQNSLGLPDPSPVEVGGPNLPYAFVADEAFPLKENLLRPFPGRQTPERQKIFNYRLSRARRVIENAFGILCQKWRLFRSPIIGYTSNIVSYLKAAIVLHNWLRKVEAPLRPNQRKYCPPKYEDRQGKAGKITKGKWRADATSHPPSNLIAVQRVGSNNHTMGAAEVRESYLRYFTTTGTVPWQYTYIRRGQDLPT